jgi:hypothetical protein
LELAFDSRPLRTLCESEAQARLELGSAVAEVLKHRLADMRAAASPQDLVTGRPRAGEVRNHMVVDLCDGHRIVFIANHPNYPKSETDELDWGRVSRIKIIRIERDNA